MKSRKNPYASKLKKQVTIRMGEDVIEYFKNMADETGIPYQSLINLYLRDCVAKHRKIDVKWLKQAQQLIRVDRLTFRCAPGQAEPQFPGWACRKSQKGR